MEEQSPTNAMAIRCVGLALSLLLVVPDVNADDLLVGLRSLPTVESVKVSHIGESPKRRVIQVMDWHMVSREAFRADLRDQSPDITDADVNDAYAAHLRDVAKVQTDVMAVMRFLSESSGVNAVHVEGLTDQNAASHRKLIRTLATFNAIKPNGNTPIEQFLLQEFELDCLRLGPAGRLAMLGKLQVLPLEEDGAYRNANPVKPDGRIVFDPKANDRREDEMVRNLLDSPHNPAVTILGNGHDLADNLKRLAVNPVELICVWPKSVTRLHKE